MSMTPILAFAFAISACAICVDNFEEKENDFPTELEGCWVASEIIEFREQTPELIGTLVFISKNAILYIRPTTNDRCSVLEFGGITIADTEPGRMDVDLSNLTLDSEQLSGMDGKLSAKKTGIFEDNVGRFNKIEIAIRDSGNAQGQMKDTDSKMTCYRLSEGEAKRRLMREVPSLVTDSIPPSKRAIQWLLVFKRIYDDSADAVVPSNGDNE